jgi:hypothetical protein
MWNSGKKIRALRDINGRSLMKANPDKFQALAIGKKSFDHKIVFELKGNRIECENDVKLLGLSLSKF